MAHSVHKFGNSSTTGTAGRASCVGDPLSKSTIAVLDHRAGHRSSGWARHRTESAYAQNTTRRSNRTDCTRSREAGSSRRRGRRPRWTGRVFIQCSGCRSIWTRTARCVKHRLTTRTFEARYGGPFPYPKEVRCPAAIPRRTRKRSGTGTSWRRVWLWRKHVAQHVATPAETRPVCIGARPAGAGT